MKRMLILILAALGLTAAWGATPVYLLNVYSSGQSQSPVAGWLNYTQASNPKFPYTDGATTTNGISVTFTNGGGNVLNRVAVDSAYGYQAGSYVDVTGTTHTTLMEEVKASLGLGFDIGSNVYNTGVGQGARGGATATIAGLDANKKYIIYVGFGIKRGDSCKSGLTLNASGYQRIGSLSKVTSDDTGYSDLAVGTAAVNVDNRLMVVRMVDIVPLTGGTVQFVLGERDGFNFIAIAENGLADGDIYKATVTGNTNWSSLKWTKGGVAGTPEATDTCEITSVEGAVIDMDYDAEEVASLTVSAGTLNVPAGKMLTVGSLTASLTGAGTVKVPSYTAAYNLATSLQASTWTGTLWCNGFDLNDGAPNMGPVIANWGNEHSKIKFTGCYGWIASGTVTAEVVLENDSDDRALEIDDGSSGASWVYCFNKISGTGTLALTKNTSNTFRPVRVEDVSDFTGSIAVTCQGVIIGAGATSTTTIPNDNVDAYNKKITLLADSAATIGASKSWTATSGIVVNGTLTNNGTIASAVTGSGRIVQTALPAAGTYLTSLQATDWTGTFELKGYTQSSGQFDPTKYGNTSSTVCLNGVSAIPLCVSGNTAGWGAARSAIKALEIGADGLNITGSFSSSFTGIIEANLTGSGTISTANAGKGAVTYTFKGDASAFAGAINVPGTANANISLIPADGTAVAKSGGVISVGAGATATIATGKTWTAAGGIAVEGTLVDNGTIGGAVSGSGRIEVAMLPADSTVLTSLQNTAWTGTLAISALNLTASTQVMLENFGNAGSTIELQGLSGSSVWLTNNANIAATVDVKGDVTFNNGGSGSTYTFSKITGDYNFGLTAWTGCYGVGLSVSAFDHYMGTVALKNGSTHANGCVETLTIGNIIVDDYAIEVPVLKVTQACTSTATKYSTAINLSSATLNGQTAKLAVASDGVYLAVASVTSGGTTTYYATLADAIAAVGNDALNTIVILEDGATVPDGYEAKDGKVSLKKLDTILPGTLTWLPVGDSITEGEQYMGHADQGTAETRGGYRYQLWKLLTDQGQATKSVGFRSGHQGTVEPDTCDWAWHGGMYGGVISPMTCSNKKYGAHLFNVESFLEVSGYPDIISIMIGINDLSFCKDVATTFAAWTQLVDKYAKLRPNSKIVVSTLLPVTTTNVTSPYWGPFNERIRAAAAAKTAPFDNANVILADVAKAAFNDAFNSAYFKSSDGIHPNETGSKMVAKAFLEQGFIPAMEAIAAEQVKVAEVNNGTAGKLAVRLSKASELAGDAVLKLEGTTVSGESLNLTLEGGTIDADKKTITFDADYTFENGSYEVQLTVGNAAIAADEDTVYDIVGTGAAANVKADYMAGFEKYQAITPESTSQTVDTEEIDMTGRKVTKVGYYMELKRAGEPAQFVWVSMDAAAFGNDLAKVGVPTTTTGTIKAVANDVTVFGNRGNFTKDVTGSTAMIEFSPYSYTAADQTGDNCIDDASPNGAFGWNDTLGSSGSYGCMQVARITGATRSATTPTAEMLFAYNAFNNSAASDIGIGSLSTHRNNAGGSIDAVYDWTWITATAQLSKFMMTAYETRKIEVWVEVEVTDPVAVIGGVKYATLADACEAAAWGDTITLLKDVTLTDATESIPTGVTIAGVGNIIANGVASFNGVTFADDYTGKILLKSGYMVLDKADAVTVEDADYASESATIYVVVSADDFVKGGYTMGLTYAGSKTVKAIANVGSKQYTETVTATEGVYTAALRTLQWAGAASTWVDWYDEGAWYISTGSTAIQTTWKEGDTNPVILTAGDCVIVDKAATPASVTVSGTSYIKGYANLGTTPITLNAALSLCGNEQVTTPLKGNGQLYFNMKYLPESEQAATDIVTADVLTDYTGAIFFRNGIYTFDKMPSLPLRGSTNATICIAADTTIDKTITFGQNATPYPGKAFLTLGAGARLVNTESISFYGTSSAPTIEVTDGVADLSSGWLSLGNVETFAKVGAGTLIVNPTLLEYSSLSGGFAVAGGTFQIGKDGWNYAAATITKPIALTGGSLALKGNGAFTISELDLADTPEPNTCILELNGTSSGVTKIVAEDVDITDKVERSGNSLYYLLTHSIDPTEGGTHTYSSEEAATQAAATINNNPEQYITAPAGLSDTDKAAYQKLFVATASGTVVTVALTTNAESAIKEEISEEDVSASVLAAAQTDGKAKVTTTPGIYYAIEYGTGVSLGKNTAGTMATSASTTLAMPAVAGDAAFFRVKASFLPIEKAE